MDFDRSEEVDGITEIVGEVKKVKVRGEIYKISACSLADMPRLQRLLAQFEQIEVSKDDDAEMMMDQKSLNLMAKIIKMGIAEHHPDISEKNIQESFSLGSFPVIVQIMMDMNDFLSGMRELKTQAAEMLTESNNTSMERLFPQASGNSKKLVRGK